MRFATLAGFGLAIAAGSLVAVSAGSPGGGLVVACVVAALYFLLAFVFRRYGFWRTVAALCWGCILYLAFSSSTDADSGGESC